MNSKQRQDSIERGRVKKERVELHAFVGCCRKRESREKERSRDKEFQLREIKRVEREGESK